MKLRKLALAPIAAAVMAMSAVPTISSAAENASLTFALTSDHCSTPCGPQTSFGTIVVTDMTGGVLDFSVSLLNGNKFVHTGLAATVAYNLTGIPQVTYTALNAGWSVVGGNPQPSDTLHMDGLGDFGYGVAWNLSGGGNGTADPLDFKVSAAGLTLGNVGTNAGGQYFAVDILSGTTGQTGAVDASLVPEPETYAMLLAGLGLMGFVARRRQRNLAA